MQQLQPAQPFKDLLGLLKKLPTSLSTELTSDSEPFKGKNPGSENLHSALFFADQLSKEELTECRDLVLNYASLGVNNYGVYREDTRNALCVLIYLEAEVARKDNPNWYQGKVESIEVTPFNTPLKPNNNDYIIEFLKFIPRIPALICSDFRNNNRLLQSLEAMDVTKTDDMQLLRDRALELAKFGASGPGGTPNVSSYNLAVLAAIFNKHL